MSFRERLKLGLDSPGRLPQHAPCIWRGGAATFRLKGSAVATELFGVPLRAWSRRSWWGPGWQSSLALSDNAPALNGVGLQRSLASTSEFLLAQLEEVGAPADPYLMMIGEDEASSLPSSYLRLYGVEAWSGAGRHRWFAELLESACKMPVFRTGVRPCAYRN